MNTLRLTAGETWAIGANRYVLDQVMGNGLLHLRCERTGAPLQVRGDQNDLICPSSSWLVEQFAAGQARHIDPKQAKSAVRKGALAFGGDYEMIVARDPSATFRLAVLTSLDRIASFSRSAEGMRKALAVVCGQPRHDRAQQHTQRHGGENPQRQQRSRKDKRRFGCSAITASTISGPSGPRRR